MTAPFGETSQRARFSESELAGKNRIRSVVATVIAAKTCP